MEKAIVEVEQPTAAAADRRRSERIDLLVRVTYQSVDELFSEFARNINEGGMFIETDEPMALGGAVALQFKLPGSDDLIEVEGIVVRTTLDDVESDAPGMGIEFGELNSEARDQINELVKRLRAAG
jgi:type IV pilus assembly protein PilZ